MHGVTAGNAPRAMPQRRPGPVHQLADQLLIEPIRPPAETSPVLSTPDIISAISALHDQELHRTSYSPEKFRRGRRGGSWDPPAGLGGTWEISFADYCGGRLARRAAALSRRPCAPGRAAGAYGRISARSAPRHARDAVRADGAGLTTGLRVCRGAGDSAAQIAREVGVFKPRPSPAEPAAASATMTSRPGAPPRQRRQANDAQGPGERPPSGHADRRAGGRVSHGPRALPLWLHGCVGSGQGIGRPYPRWPR